MDTFYGPRPVIGDKVYVDLGDSLIDGGEMVGWVSYIDPRVIILCDDKGRITESFDPYETTHIEIMES